MTYKSQLEGQPLSVRRAQRAYLAAVFNQASRKPQTTFLAELLEISPRSVQLASRLLDSRRHDLVTDVLRGYRSLTAAVRQAEDRERQSSAGEAVGRAS